MLLSAELTEMGFGPWDLEALIFFVLAWISYTLIADHSPLQRRSISFAMARQRRQWMQQAAHRELRMIDTGVISNLITGISFFASTTIFVIGGLIAALGYTSELASAFQAIPLASDLTAEQGAIRLTVLLVIFIYAFFKFAWALRLDNYCSILVGGFDNLDNADPLALDKRAAAASEINTLSGYHFNRGIRGYFFALAVVGWFIHPLLFVLDTIAVMLILVRREFSSKAARAVWALTTEFNS